MHTFTTDYWFDKQILHLTIHKVPDEYISYSVLQQEA
jgi:hypothetical protein